MKTVFLVLIALLICSTLSWLSSPLSWLSIPDFFMNLSWVGIELITVLIGTIAFIAVIALLGMGLIGAFLVVFIGLVLALLFNSILIAIPLLLLVGLGWLVFEPVSGH
ncbi:MULTISPECIES: hypothetical protein [Pseudoalteromonas]|uniref:Uncharacterized protein n=1 Tax=Pseudoalteromonas amylolytica TaxID=1859457 RepID=A0A1S1MVC7_9GAMM|nr:MULTISPECIES: hypothetical protein [Pseudoalteromonas]MCF6434994.1 hypothetical protein [Pseudoalteromonas sp. MMG022]OHU90659.1 hypothetical protein BFC16_03380 [Pseudoalteromonas sp. JW3]OHU92720.1 hypothetical protein BET10_04510 [Pseudoalteromonas amylolytica]